MMILKHELTKREVEQILDLLNAARLYIVQEWVTDLATEHTGNEDPFAGSDLIFDALDVTR
jgi:hypothetical protein